jgi:hypothetical protein
MNHFKDLLAKLLLAAFLLGGAGQAAAGPAYSITIDTSTLGAGPAYLGLYFLGLADAAPATATVDNLSGALSGPASLTGQVAGSVPGPFVFNSGGGGGDLVQEVTLGGVLSFNVSFTLGAGNAGSTFGWALFNQSSYLGADGDLGTVSLQPGGAPADAYVVNNFSALSSVQPVPEPSSIALLLAGLVLLAFHRRLLTRK